MEPLNGVMPGSGFHVRWLGLWADIADGVSVQNLQVCEDLSCVFGTKHRDSRGELSVVAWWWDSGREFWAAAEPTTLRAGGGGGPQEAGKPPLKPEMLIEMLSKRINPHELVQGAIFDLLFSQCDRHQQNIFLTEEGKFWLIDNDQVNTQDFACVWRTSEG